MRRTSSTSWGTASNRSDRTTGEKHHLKTPKEIIDLRGHLKTDVKTIRFCVKPRRQCHLPCYLMKFQSNASSHFSSVRLWEDVEWDRLARKGIDRERNILNIFLRTRIDFKFLMHVTGWQIRFALSLSLPHLWLLCLLRILAPGSPLQARNHLEWREKPKPTTQSGA